MIDLWISLSGGDKLLSYVILGVLASAVFSRQVDEDDGFFLTVIFFVGTALAPITALAAVYNAIRLSSKRQCQSDMP